MLSLDGAYRRGEVDASEHAGRAAKHLAEQAGIDRSLLQAAGGVAPSFSTIAAGKFDPALEERGTESSPVARHGVAP